MVRIDRRSARVRASLRMENTGRLVPKADEVYLFLRGGLIPDGRFKGLRSQHFSKDFGQHLPPDGRVQAGWIL